MAKTVGDFLLERLACWGVDRLFGYPGDGINGIVAALGRAQDKLEFIQARHEEEAAFMASGHAKLTGGVGVCLATSGPGAIHLLNGLYDAKLDRKPVVAIVGEIDHAVRRGWRARADRGDQSVGDRCPAPIEHPVRGDDPGAGENESG